MAIENDETLQIYLEESLEHLADIENDFLEIERAGADIDEELVNKVYRAAHSIKGGAGFMGLTIIKDLTHEMENILGKIRSRDLIPNPEIINILLMASDALKELIEDVFNSNEADIEGHLIALKAVAEGMAHSKQQDAPKQEPPQPKEQPAAKSAAPQEAEEPDSEKIAISFPDGKYVLHASQKDMTAVSDDGKIVYLIETDLIKDVHKKDRMPLEFVDEMRSCGDILDCMIDIEAAGTLETDSPEQLPFVILFASILKPNDINKLFEIDEKGIFEVKEDFEVVPIAEPDSSEAFILEADETTESVEEPTQPEPVEEVTTSEITESEITEPEMDEQQAVAVEAVPKETPEVKTETPAPPKVDPAPKPAVNKTETPSPRLAATEEKPDKGGPPVAVASETSLRVHVSLLDALMNLAGELVLSRNQLLQSITSSDQRASELAGQRIDLITSELQEAIMLTRMQAIGNVFNKFPRVVRDLSRKLGKEIDLIVEGDEVEMDKTIIEAISDPLTHLVRNSVDHGIERPDQRQDTGKDTKGQIKLKAFHEAGQVNIEIIDDGKGLDGKKLAATAVSKGLITEEQSATMSDKERVNLIFLPGFSTAEQITDVSGRGVGMDVVKTNLDKLGGIVDIDSELGAGTSIRIKLPLTLAIIPSQIIVTGTERYAIPQVNLEELLRIPAAQVKERIERVGDAEVVRLRGNLLPLVKLTDVIGVEKKYINPETYVEEIDRRESISDRRSRENPLFGEGSQKNMAAEESTQGFETGDTRTTAQERRFHAQSALNIVVVSTGSMKYGLVVDQLLDSEEIVVKPLGRHLKQCNGYAGATIMGDGRVALILDVSNLARMAELTSLGGTDRAAEVKKEDKASIAAKRDKQSLLIFRSSEEEQFVVPLNQVERIEKIKLAQVEEVGGRKVLQYRGASLPLFSIDQVAQVKPLEDKADLLVVVFNIAGRTVGLMAMGPVDVMQIYVEFDDSTVRQPGILGSAIIGDHTTMLVDIFEIVQTLNPEWFTEQEVIETEDGFAPTVLVVEDSNFFRNQVRGYMENDGYNVIDAEDGLIAWDLLQEHESKITLVCTDIEMPNLDGFGLAERIRAQERFSSLPIIALTSLAGEADIARGNEVGIDEYHLKLDKEKLMDAVHNFLQKGRPV